jgi:hypothetical protein
MGTVEKVLIYFSIMTAEGTVEMKRKSQLMGIYCCPQREIWTSLRETMS